MLYCNFRGDCLHLASTAQCMVGAAGMQSDCLNGCGMSTAAVSVARSSQHVVCESFVLLHFGQASVDLTRLYYVCRCSLMVTWISPSLSRFWCVPALD